MSQSFRNPPDFLLCPVYSLEEAIAQDVRYHPEFLNTVSSLQAPRKANCITIYSWAEFGSCRIYNNPYDLEDLAQLTVWTDRYLKELVQMRQRIFLMSLRVHRFSQPLEVEIEAADENKIGRYLEIPNSTFSERASVPLLTQETFQKRERDLFKLALPPHPELAQLQSELVAIREMGLGAMSLDRDVRYFLGWTRPEDTQLDNSDLAWIQQITPVARTGEQAKFRSLVRKSLLKLGFSNRHADPQFSLDPDTPARAGDYDFYGERPYAVIGLCQAGDRPPDTTGSNISSRASEIPAQLNTSKLIHLGQAKFSAAVKLIFTTGSLTQPAHQTARENAMNVLQPATLQRLSELKAQFPGAIDLLQLKSCLQAAPFGEDANAKVHQWIDHILGQLQLRAAIIQAVKQCPNNPEEGTQLEEILTIYQSFARAPLPQLQPEELFELLVELSSPLAGYLGRHKSDEGDRFYFLRELLIEDDSLTTQAR